MRTHRVLFFYPTTDPQRLKELELNNLEMVSATLMSSLEEIRLIHRLKFVDGRQVCDECEQIWPCRTSQFMIHAKTAGVRHMKASIAHVKGQISRREVTLQKIDEYFSALNCVEAETVISLTHNLCVAETVQVYGFVNALGEHEFQVERSIDEDSSAPLWSLTIGHGLGVRVFSPFVSNQKEPFFTKLLQLGFQRPDVDELIEWWAKLSPGSNTYATSPLPGDVKLACDVITKLCHATAEFCDEDWLLMNELF